MSEVLVPRDAIAELYNWAFKHPKFYSVDRTDVPTDPIMWAKERLVVNHSGRLLIRLAGQDDKIREYSGDLTSEKRLVFDTDYVMGIYVVYHEGDKTQQNLRYKIHRPTVDKLVLSQAQLNDASEGYELIEPDLDGFLGHVAAITSVTDFDWTEAQAIADSFRSAA